MSNLILLIRFARKSSSDLPFSFKAGLSMINQEKRARQVVTVKAARKKDQT